MPLNKADRIAKRYNKKLANPLTHAGAVNLEVSRDSALINAENRTSPVTVKPLPIESLPKTINWNGETIDLHVATSEGENINSADDFESRVTYLQNQLLNSDTKLPPKPRGHRYSEIEIAVVGKLLAYFKGNKTRTCQVSGVTRMTLRKWINNGTLRQPINQDQYWSDSKGGRGNKWDSDTKEKALEIFKRTGNLATASRQTGVPDSTISTWGKEIDKYEKWSIEELEAQYEHLLAEADRIDKIKQKKEQERKSLTLELLNTKKELMETHLREIKALDAQIQALTGETNVR